MGVSSRRTALVGLVLACLVGCADQRAGTPAADDSGSDQTSSAVPGSTAVPTSTRPSAEASALGELNPCTLLTEAEQGGLRLPSGEPGSLAGESRCRWNRGGGNGIVDVTLHVDKGIDQLNPAGASKVQDVDVGAHRGRRLEYAHGNCQFDIAVTDGSSVTVSALIVEQLTQACTLAEQAALVIEPKLPRG